MDATPSPIYEFAGGKRQGCCGGVRSTWGPEGRKGKGKETVGEETGCDRQTRGVKQMGQSDETGL